MMRQSYRYRDYKLAAFDPVEQVRSGWEMAAADHESMAAGPVGYAGLRRASSTRLCTTTADQMEVLK
jgi:hypothetical protein